MTIELADILKARERIGNRLRPTPVFSASSLGELAGVRLHLKAELFQKTGSFKVRGVLNTLLAMDPAERARGLVSLSAGNHGAALAWGARLLGARATIVMPAHAVAAKIAATRAYGGEVVLTERPLLETCQELMHERGLVLVHPFDDPRIIAGQGTVGLEIAEQVPEVEAVLVPVGGGGLIAGIAAALKALRPAVRVIGVEPRGADAMSRALAAGRPVQLDRIETVADGLAAPFAGQHALAQVRRDVDQVVLVEDQAILHALGLLYQRAKLAAEPAAAAGLAALLSGAAQLPPGTVTVAVISGGNVNPDLLKRLW